MTTYDQTPERQEIEALLPWHATGTLSERDAQRVEEALAEDRELARRYALVREELAATVRANVRREDLFARYGGEEFGMVLVETHQQGATELAERIRGIVYNRIAVVALGYHRSEVPGGLDGFGYIAPQRERRDILGVQWCSSIFPERAPAGMVLLRVLAGGWHRCATRAHSSWAVAS